MSYNFGVQHELFPRIAVSFNYFYTRYYNLSNSQNTLQSFAVVILGGLGRVSATVVGGLAFGLIEVLGQSAPGLGSGYAGAIAFVVLVIVLVVRPRGLLGRLA